MAGLRFWSVVLVDLSHLATASLMLGLLWSRGLTVTDFLLALAAGQARRHRRRDRPAGSGRPLAGPAYGSRRPGRRGLPRGRRVRALARGPADDPARPPSTRCGSWSWWSPGSAAFGRLEAARVYMSPALLLVQGIGSYLLARYASDRHQSLHRSVRRADTAAVALVAGQPGPRGAGRGHDRVAGAGADRRVVPDRPAGRRGVGGLLGVRGGGHALRQPGGRAAGARPASYCSGCSTHRVSILVVVVVVGRRGGRGLVGAGRAREWLTARRLAPAVGGGPVRPGAGPPAEVGGLAAELATERG